MTDNTPNKAKQTSGPSDRAIAQAWKECCTGTYAPDRDVVLNRARELDAAHPVAAANTKPCPKCSAPCTTDTHIRGGDYGWSTSDEERTVYTYAHPVVAFTPQAEYPVADDCFCDANGLGKPGVSCGDCPRDYQLPTPAAQPADNADAAGVQGSVSDEDVEAACDAFEETHGTGRDAMRAALESFLANRIAAQKCGCGLATCVDPWEPGCGLGQSKEHAVRVDDSAAQKGGDHG